MVGLGAGYLRLGRSTCCHTQDLGQEEDLVGELGDSPAVLLLPLLSMRARMGGRLVRLG